jgi:hypothetical protein
MYCSSCGVAVAQGLSYCKNCGAKLINEKRDDASKSPEVRPELLVAAMVALFIFGILAITLLMGVMRNAMGLPSDLALGVGLCCFLLLLLLEGVFIRLLFRRTRGAGQESNKVSAQEQNTKELEAAQTRVLPEGMPSVTEHTTRAFDPIYNERK